MGKLEDKAQELLDETGLSQVPVPVEQIAKKLGVDVVYEPAPDSVSGMLFREGDVARIGVNSSHAHVRQRFTIAHELGHLRLHPGRKMFVDKAVRIDLRDERSSTATDKQEIEANGFAANLLMPVSLLVEEAERFFKRNSNASVDELATAMAERFDVSVQAMRIRLANLGVCDPE